MSKKKADADATTADVEVKDVAASNYVSMAMDDIDADAVRATENPADLAIGGADKLLRIPVKKPSSSEFFRAHPSMQLAAYVLEDGEGMNRRKYLVGKNCQADAGGVMKMKLLILCASRSGAFFLWPVGTTPAGSPRNTWVDSAREAAKIGESKWVRLESNQAAGYYDVKVARKQGPDPVWPEELTMNRVLGLAFGDGCYINDLNHPVLKKLRGED